MAQQLGECAGGDNFAPMHTRPGAKVNDVVSPAHCRFVVFDHQDGVAAGFELLERRQQLLVVARMKTDRRLIEDIKHSAQVRAELRRQPNALALAAG